jgi:hypothetical protein
MTRTIILAASAAVCLTALAVAAQVTPEQQAAIASAIEANGCRVTSENNSAILEAAGLAEADAATVVQALLDAGTALIVNGELVLVSEACPKP